MTEYLMPYAYGQAEFTEKKSRFIGHIWPVTTEEEAVAHIKEMREKHWDATHNVYAYIIKEGGIMRYSDDGEPQGTSGIPTLSVLQNEGLTNVCCVITRYFGGTLLGAGGLVRAYSHSAKIALDAAGIMIMRLWDQVLIPCSYSAFEKVKKEIGAFGGIIQNTDYGADILIEALFPIEHTSDFEKRLLDATAGTVKTERIAQEFRGVKKE